MHSDNPFYFTLLGLTICFAVTTTSCKRLLPANHIPPKKMEQVLMDVSLAETYSTMTSDNQHTRGVKNSDSLSVYYKTIFAHYDITQNEFDESMQWYKAHPEELDTVYSHMIATIGKMQGQPAGALK